VFEIKNPYFTEKVKPIEIKEKSISQLLKEMSDTGFQGRKLGEAADVWGRMIKDKDVTIIMGFAGSMSTTGQWKIINWLIENHFIDILVSTGANISEDIVDAMGHPYWKGNHTVDDADLLKYDINRYYDVFGSDVEYTEMIELTRDFILTLKENHPYSSREFLYLFGKWLSKKNIKSIVATAAENKVPVFCPAIVDSTYGDACLLAKANNFNLILDQAQDYREFMGLAGKVEDIGVIYIGGGVPKDFIQLLAVSSPYLNEDKKFKKRNGIKRNFLDEHLYPHKYAIQITTDSPQWGGLSGCTFEEAISWGKITREKDNRVICYCDATIALPIIIHALNEKIKMKRRGKIFSEFFKE
jgi:deoxyhypusine synthase